MFKGLRNSARGFTLVEVMIVVAIIGILTAIATPAVQGVRRRGRVRLCISFLDQIRTAQDRWVKYPEIDGYADSLDDSYDFGSDRGGTLEFRDLLLESEDVWACDPDSITFTVHASGTSYTVGVSPRWGDGSLEGCTITTNNFAGTRLYAGEGWANIDSGCK